MTKQENFNKLFPTEVTTRFLQKIVFLLDIRFQNAIKCSGFAITMLANGELILALLGKIWIFLAIIEHAQA